MTPARPSVLVVDDQAALRDLLRLVLEERGYEVAGARDGVEALAYLERRLPALIVLDWMMPRMSGPSFVRELRRRAEFGRVPILVLTAYGSELEAAQVGARGWLRKPFDLGVLLELIEGLAAGGRVATP